MCYDCANITQLKGSKNINCDKNKNYYSAPDQVMKTAEELMAQPFLAEKVSCQRESFPIFPYLCIGISVFGQR